MLGGERSPLALMGAVFSWPEDTEQYYRYLTLAEEACLAVFEEFPDSPSAAEARYLLGLINDHPYLNNFETAVLEYGRTVERYPGSPAAAKAAARLKILERYFGGHGGRPRGFPGDSTPSP